MPHKDLRLNCFSPPVMIATFVFEIALAGYALWRYRRLALTRLIVATLACLATFQLAEWMVCQGAMGLSSLEWAKLGFVAISFLPPIGIHMATHIAGKSLPRMILACYALAGMFSLYFLFATRGITGSVCGGNYVIFHLAPQAVNMFATYYYSMLMLGTGLALYWAAKVHNIHQKSALHGLAAGYAAFIVPTISIILLNRDTVAGIPSIMCGFAVTLAVVLVWWVLPKYAAFAEQNEVVPTIKPADAH